MIPECQDDFRWLLRNRSGYFPWLAKHPWQFLSWTHRHCKMWHCDEPSAAWVMSDALESPVLPHPLFDIFWRSLVRAEARFISRYIPQRSHEERLTGHLVSETDNSICLLRERFRKASEERYAEPRDIDFLYYDLSRGGRIEKHTGADLGFIVSVDLPDYPPITKAFVFQAKKVNGNAELDIVQYRMLCRNEDAAAYLFYDMDMKRLTAPMVLTISDGDMTRKFEAAVQKDGKSFTITMDDIMDGMPFSLYVLSEMEKTDAGLRFPDLTQAVRHFRDVSYQNIRQEVPFSGILGIVRLGSRIVFEPNSDMGLDVSA